MTKILIGISIIYFTLIPIITKADGGIIFSAEIDVPEEEINLPSQSAIIFWDGENETLSLSTGIKAKNLADLAWVIPVPSKENPEVTEENTEIFNQVPYLFSEIKMEMKTDWTGFWPLLLPLALLFVLLHKKRRRRDITLEIVFIITITLLISITFVSMGRTREGKIEVTPIEVIETKKVGIYDMVILKATDANYMVNWLNEQGFKIAKENIPVLQEYCDQPNFYFIVNKISQETLSQKDLLEGIATPLKIKFQPEQPFYPLKLSSINGGPTVINVYLFSENPVRDQSGTLSIKRSRRVYAIHNAVYMSKNEEFTNAVNNFFSLFLLDPIEHSLFAATWLRYEDNLENLQKDAYFKFDSVTCESLPQEKGVKITQDSCYKTLAVSTNNSSFCDKIIDRTKRDNCYYFDFAEQNPFVCEKLSDKKLTPYCYRRFTSQFSTLSECLKEAPSQYVKGFCYEKFAAETKDSSLCEKIIDQEVKKNCYKYSAP